jgi:hypothetical protein
LVLAQVPVSEDPHELLVLHDRETQKAAFPHLGLRGGEVIVGSNRLRIPGHSLFNQHFCLLLNFFCASP